MPSPFLYESSKVQTRLGSADVVVAAIGMLQPREVHQVSLHAAGPWAVRFAASTAVDFGVAAQGECWLTVDGCEPVLLGEGDFYLLGSSLSYILGSNPMQDPMDAWSVWGGPAQGPARLGSEAQDDVFLCGGEFSFDDMNAGILLDVLPPLVVVRAADPRGELLAHVSALLVSEIDSCTAGSPIVVDHLAQILFVHMLRAHADQTDRPRGWLGALGNDGIGTALRAMHANVAHRWTLKELAQISRMSRSAFTASFKYNVGAAPLNYLIEWRMSLARDALRRGTRTIAELASATGYESESAFSTAFRRVVGASPRQYRDKMRLAVTTNDAVSVQSIF